mgnify:CR=1 FL=1
MDEYSLSIILDDIDDTDAEPVYYNIIKNQSAFSFTNLPDDIIFDDLKDYL